MLNSMSFIVASWASEQKIASQMGAFSALQPVSGDVYFTHLFACLAARGAVKSSRGGTRNMSRMTPSGAETWP